MDALNFAKRSLCSKLRWYSGQIRHADDYEHFSYYTQCQITAGRQILEIEKLIAEFKQISHVDEPQLKPQSFVYERSLDTMLRCSKNRLRFLIVAC